MEQEEARSSNGKLSGTDAVRAAREVVEEMTGKRAETVSGLNRSGDGGWTVRVDVVELTRVPTSTDVLATYEVSLDEGGDLVDFQRTRRFARNQASEE